MAEESSYLADLKSISALYKESITADNLEIDMTTSLHEILQHIKMARTLDAQLTHHLLSTTAKDISGGELMMYSSRLLRTATFAKEKLLNYTQRYMLVNSIYRMAAKTDKVSEKRKLEWYEDREHDTNKIASRVSYELTILDRHISDIEQEISRAEKTIFAENVKNTNSFVNAFNNAIDRVEKKVIDVIQQLINKNEHSRSSSQEKRKRNIDDKSDGPNSSKVQVLSDEDYMDKLIEENRDNQEEQEEEEEEHRQQEERRQQEEERHRQQEEERRRQQDEERHRQQEEDRRLEEERERRQERYHYIDELEKELDELYKGRFLLPRRKIGNGTHVAGHIRCAFCGMAGSHYSDSCSKITSGQKRYEFIQQENRCQLCLGKGHDPESCRTEEKGCWYCNVVKSAALDFLIYDEAHHRAICNIPDSKDRITERIKAVREQINRAKYQVTRPGV